MKQAIRLQLNKVVLSAGKKIHHCTLNDSSPKKHTLVKSLDSKVCEKNVANLLSRRHKLNPRPKTLKYCRPRPAAGCIHYGLNLSFRDVRCRGRG